VFNCFISQTDDLACCTIHYALWYYHAHIQAGPHCLCTIALSRGGQMSFRMTTQSTTHHEYYYACMHALSCSQMSTHIMISHYIHPHSLHCIVNVLSQEGLHSLHTTVLYRRQMHMHTSTVMMAKSTCHFICLADIRTLIQVYRQVHPLIYFCITNWRDSQVCIVCVLLGC
jgi:hypothetical protein